MVSSTILDNTIQQNLLDYSAILETTINDANIFLSEVSRVYGSIGNQFPVIEQEMQNENKKATDILSYFTNKVENEKNFARDLDENQTEFRKSFERLQEFIEEDDILSESIIKDVGKTSNIMESIEQIRMLADQIKIYSLNAIIISSKYGVIGRAFGEISKNIIKLSEMSNEQADYMNRVGNELFVRFEDFKTEILKVNDSQRKNFDIMQEELKREHNNMVSSFSTFSNIISNVVNRVDNTYNYIFEIMTVLQREDIVRQQTEHIIDSIRTIVEENKKFIEAYGEKISTYSDSDIKSDDTDSLEHLILDLVTFDDVVLTLVIENLKTIYEEINNTNKYIYHHLHSLKNTLNDIANDRNVIVEYMIGGEKGKSEFPFTVSDLLFSEYMGFIKLYLDNFKLFLTNKYSISDSNIVISDSIENLESMFLETKNIAKTFNAINFLAKIELEKNSVIFSNSQTFSIESVEAIASNITETVDKCLEQFHNIKNEIFGSIDKFRNNINQQALEYDSIQSMTDKVSKRLESSKYLIKENIKRFEGYAVELFKLIDQTLSDLSSLETLLTSVNEIIEICTSMQTMIKEKKEMYYERLGINNWQIESQKYLDIVNSYTIQKERAIANSVLKGEAASNIKIDVGSDSGDLTIF